IVVCWLVPLIIVVTLAGVLLEKSYQSSAQQEIEASAANAMQQVQMQLENAVNDSKAVSYDGVIRSAYRSFQQDGNIAVLYRSVNDYLAQTFSREMQYKVVFISFWDETAAAANSYLLSSGTTGSELLRECQRCTQTIITKMFNADTEIRFLILDGRLYMARNLLDSRFVPYATVVMMLDSNIIFHSLEGITRIEEIQLYLDNCTFTTWENGMVIPQAVESEDEYGVRYSATVDGHSFAFTADLIPYDLWAENPWMQSAILAVALMVIPLLGITIWLFTYHVTRPINKLAEAHSLVQAGQRGYEIAQASPNTEFAKLYDHFNAMSADLKHQFEQSYLEQQASQRAQIKALQSQINPHFLNNTLEIINWEARFAGNDRVSAMIEALSTMLDATLDRDGRTQIPLREELGYVDAYLYIIRERLGESFIVHKQIDESILELAVPRLLLQPIVENAVEHDITGNRGGNLWMRAYCSETDLILEVEHDGQLNDIDRAKVTKLLTDPNAKSARVGLSNVVRRVKLIYGEAGKISIDETGNGTILAQVCLPLGE
ncbi:MAG: histidine kinase, partial [Oscillospiraceae bacterium]|nr:histidine kinase [Oscillospiraceae bacterium]